MHMLLILLALCLRKSNGISHLFSTAYAFAGNSCQEYVPALKPPIVLWSYFEGNDLEDLGKEKHSPLLMSYLTP